MAAPIPLEEPVTRITFSVKLFIFLCFKLIKQRWNIHSPKKYRYYTNRYKYLRCGWVRLLPVGNRGDAGMLFKIIAEVIGFRETQQGSDLLYRRGGVF